MPPAPPARISYGGKAKLKTEKPFDWVAFLMFWADLATAHEKKVYCIAS